MQEVSKAVIERLRRSKQATMAHAYRDGIDFGRNWAETKAEWCELVRLTKYRKLQMGGWESLFTNDHFGSAPGNVLYEAMTTISDGDKATDFWESLGISEEQMEEGEFMRGFAEAAIELFEIAESEIRRS